MSVAWVILSAIVTVFQGYTIDKYCCIFVPRSKNENGVFIAWVCYYTWQLLSGIFVYTGNPILFNMVESILLFTVLMMLAYEGEILKKVMLIIVYQVLGVCSDVICSVLLSVVIGDRKDLQLVGAAMVSVVLFTIVCILAVLFKSVYVTTLHWKNALLMICIPIGSIFIINTMYAVAGDSIYMLVTTLIILTLNMIIFSTYTRLAEQIVLQQSVERYCEQLDLCERYLRSKEESVYEYRKVAHDMKHQYYVLLSMLNKKEYEEIEVYLKDLMGYEYGVLERIVKTNHVIIDSLLNHKYEIAIRNEIAITMEVQLPSELPIKAPDLAILLGNMLDNAIEACEKIPYDDRKITLIMSYDKGNLHLYLANTYDGELSQDYAGNLQTSKVDKVQHGIGMYSIGSVVKAYRGHLEICTENHLFELNILLYAW